MTRFNTRIFPVTHGLESKNFHNVVIPTSKELAELASIYFYLWQTSQTILPSQGSLNVYINLYIYIYMYVCIYIYICMYMYIYIYVNCFTSCDRQHDMSTISFRQMYIRNILTFYLTYILTSNLALYI